jgi:hypothetical protein
MVRGPLIDELAIRATMTAAPIQTRRRAVFVRDADALDQRADARDLGAAELVVLEVDDG